jgi:hypothetical protein
MTDQTKPISPWRGWNKTAYGIQTKGRPCTWSWWTDAEHFYQLAKVRASEMQQTSNDDTRSERFTVPAPLQHAAREPRGLR